MFKPAQSLRSIPADQPRCPFCGKYTRHAEDCDRPAPPAKAPANRDDELLVVAQIVARDRAWWAADPELSRLDMMTGVAYGMGYAPLTEAERQLVRELVA